MAYDPMEFFQAGQKIGKSRYSGLSAATGNVMDAFNKKRDMDFKAQSELGLEKAKRQLPMDPKDQAMANSYQANADWMNNNPGSSNSMDGFNTSNLGDAAKSLGVPEEDLQLEPNVSHYKGRAIINNVAKLKPILPSKESSEVTDLDKQLGAMSENLKMLSAKPSIGKQMGPSILGKLTAGRNVFSNTALDVESAFNQDARDFKVFKSEAYKAFDTYRKWATGVQASYPEIKLLEVSVPQPTSDSTTFTQQSQEAIRRMQKNRQMFLDFQSKRGYRVGGLRNPIQDGQMAEMKAKFNADVKAGIAAGMDENTAMQKAAEKNGLPQKGR